MKLKIAFFLLISMPIIASESTVRSNREERSLKIQMPNSATILAVLNSMNIDGNAFLDTQRNQAIALGLANQEFSREEIILFLFDKTQSRNIPELSLKCSFLIDIAQAAVKRPGLEQNECRK